jgi:hypothetical protein
MLDSTIVDVPSQQSSTVLSDVTGTDVLSDVTGTADDAFLELKGQPVAPGGSDQTQAVWSPSHAPPDTRPTVRDSCLGVYGCSTCSAHCHGAPYHCGGFAGCHSERFNEVDASWHTARGERMKMWMRLDTS